MDQYKDEISISLKGMVLAVLRRWRGLVAVALILAVVAGGAKGITSIVSARNAGARAKAMADYEKAYTDYENQKADLEREVARLEREIESQQAYAANSVLMSIDPYHAYEGKMYLYFSTGYQVMPDSVLQNVDETPTVVLLYRAAVQGSQVLAPVAKDLGIEERYLRELVKVSVDTTGQTIKPILNITVHGASEEQVTIILDGIMKELDDVQRGITASVGKHTAEKVLGGVSEYVDQSIADTQQNTTERLKELQENLDENTENLSKLAEPGDPGFTMKSAVKSAVKYGVVFGILGLLLWTVVCCMQYVVSDRVYSGIEVRERCGIRVLGSVAPAKKRMKLDDRLWRAEGRAMGGDRDYQRIAANIRNYAGDDIRKILILGETGSGEGKAAADTLCAALPEMSMTAGGSLLRDPEAAEKIGQYQGVLILARCGESRYSAVTETRKYVQDMGKALLGCVVVDA